MRYCHYTLLSLVPLMLGACTFDRSRLDEGRCSTSADCFEGVCVSGFCRTDGGAGNEPDTSRHDTTVQDPSTDDAHPRDGGMGHDGWTQDSEYGDCNGGRNACGGCEPLEPARGAPCGSGGCGTWTCDGPNDLVCSGDTVNACGGCEPLEAEPGDACGSCGRQWACNEEGGLDCVGPEENVCGGCGGPTGEIGAPCICYGVLNESHLWECVADQLACMDGNDEQDAPTNLPESNDDVPDWVAAGGALVTGEEVDWFAVHVLDFDNLEDGMYPDVRLTGLSRDLDLCAFWLFDQTHSGGISCHEGIEATADGIPGCCSLNTDTADEVVALRNSEFWTDRLDTEWGGGNDSGTLYIRVTGAIDVGCDTYELYYRF